MPSSKTLIANMALRHVGVSETVADIDAASNRSAQARAVRDFYDTALDELLRDFDWPFARRVSPSAGLALVESQPTTEWQYSYRLPSEALAVRRVINGTYSRIETPLSRSPFSVIADDAGPLLLTDYQSQTTDALRVVYTTRVTDVSRFPPDFAQSLALLIAGYIAPSITAGDSLKLGERALQKYAWRLGWAKTNAATEEQPDQPGDGSLVTTRN